MPEHSPSSSPKARFLHVLDKLRYPYPQWVWIHLFKSIGQYWTEYGQDQELLGVVARKTEVPLPIARLYVVWPLVSVFERWRRRQPLKIKNALASTTSSELQEWIIGLSVYHTINKFGGTLAHSALLRQLDHQVEAQEIKGALALLRDASLIESFTEPGKRPWRAHLYHRISFNEIKEEKIESVHSLLVEMKT